ncbi:altered inheritance of mitochondria protein 21 [Pseudomassariella vexata]|uniref:Altered inheritance of mitochondria protein 21 n=1 Tax=Pseudomassariella vexata TaxID=1141098 RepID=A0A1Y2DT84_9PEZI|nr:altered inheritance of mitochondria protein 21 [Pseudomassariella vexata]ORY62488.1 altered inheritance of mitochondria protein 21 [Pseudomassariella vexata]
MSATTMQQTPAIPPRPSRSAQEKENGPPVPTIPPRPINRNLTRSISPNPDRFAPSPLNETVFHPQSSPRNTRFNPSSAGKHAEHMGRSSSTDLPSIGQEGQEYAAVIDSLGPGALMSSSPETERRPSVSLEQTRTIGQDLKLHAPKPTMPAQSAKQRVAQVTRTDSDRAAAFGIGKPNSEDPYPRSLKKKASTTSQLSHHSEIFDDEQGIPEIGQRVPLIHNAGDVQAPSPAPTAVATEGAIRPGRHHSRKHSGRGFESVPPGSYGLHGHGTASTDKLEQAYYEKHPELKSKEKYNHLHDRVTDYSRSSEELNKIVRDTASRGAGFGTSGYVATPSEQVGYHATDEYTSRISSPRPPSTTPKESQVKSPLKKQSFSGPDISISGAEDSENDVIHVDEHGKSKAFVKYGDESSAIDDVEDDYATPILAPDEVAKDPSPYEQHPAVPPPERRGSAFEAEQPRSRPPSRPTSVYSPLPPEMRSTPLDDVEEYEPLFPENDKTGKKHMTQAEKLKLRQRFPSKDIWEDAPDSVHDTAEVSTPEPTEEQKKSQDSTDVPPRDTETPAQAFARRQEELAELEDRSPDGFLNRKQRPPSWHEHQSHLAKEMHSRPNMTQRFPSRDVWEDTPDSHQLQTTVSTPQQEEQEPQSATAEPAFDRPAIPARPRKHGSVDDKPGVPERPKPQFPARLSKSTSGSKALESAPAQTQKPAIPPRPVGGKIAALQAGFMSDLNKRLQIGPPAPKKDEPKAEEVLDGKEKAPLVDARKGRARGPQRRAPTKSPSTNAPPSTSDSRPVLTFSTTRVLWCIDEEGTMTVDERVEELPSSGQSKQTETAKDEENELPKEQETVSAKTKSEHEESKTQTMLKSNETMVEKPNILANNMAGESVLEETVAENQGDDVQKVEGVKDEVVS